MSEIPEDKKPPVPVRYSGTSYLECRRCDKKVIHECTPWIVMSFRGVNNIVRRCICTKCHNWHEEYGCAAIIQSRAPVKNKYDEIAYKASLKDLTDQFEKVTEWRRKEESR